jgi:hypothetical protein
MLSGIEVCKSHLFTSLNGIPVNIVNILSIPLGYIYNLFVVGSPSMPVRRCVFSNLPGFSAFKGQNIYCGTTSSFARTADS